MKMMEMARLATDIFALARQKNRPAQAAKRHLFGDARQQNYV
jgi:hypothetical protein